MGKKKNNSQVGEILHKINLPLSAADLIKLLPGIKIVTYDELHKIKNIDDILYPSGKCVILYMNGENFGHWTCLYVSSPSPGLAGDSILNFFDSYGGKPDNFKILQYIPNDIVMRKHQDFSYLADLMRNSRYKKLSYNDKRLQGPHTSTCGRYVALRLIVDCSDDEFEKFLRPAPGRPHYVDYDYIVTELTSMYPRR
jgi:hypothetical protein